MATRHRAAACSTVPTSSLPLLLLLLAAITTHTRSEWVDYPSAGRCGVTIPVEQCDPADAAANSACRDVCHYGGCRKGGRCVSLGLARGRGCHCKC